MEPRNNMSFMGNLLLWPNMPDRSHTDKKFPIRQGKLRSGRVYMEVCPHYPGTQFVVLFLVGHVHAAVARFRQGSLTKMQSRPSSAKLSRGRSWRGVEAYRQTQARKAATPGGPSIVSSTWNAKLDIQRWLLPAGQPPAAYAQIRLGLGA